MKRRLSPKQMAAFGWTRQPGDGRYASHSYRHRDGWTISHCGHPTALWPYMLVDPAGNMILTGAAGPLRRADYGTAWPTVAAAVQYVASLSN